ncbi:hypothetical protein G7070_07535 [Propioniciclava coleopterorum]|uniref:Uncharacterized protein n=1 Tax=Propioniciclava coleopterorum TaxID=2714937 RepID=A0A6G7Y675_9ACTN|nr:hypothetical protein [Propioniciclava coleopterorum]QIK72148.1 hypothetical protein G7070_07535 [Propioniciclava coleopterorum]
MPDSSFAAELIETWARRVAMVRRSPAPALLGWGDLEVEWSLRADEAGGYAVVRWSRGTEVTRARFAALADAHRFLLVQFAAVWRSDQGRGEWHPEGYPVGVTAQRGPAGTELVGVPDRASFAIAPDARLFAHARHFDLPTLSSVCLTRP